MTCDGLGMPFHKTPYKNGNLFINFKIKFPDTIDKNQVGNIGKVLSSQKKSETEKAELNDVAESVTL